MAADLLRDDGWLSALPKPIAVLSARLDVRFANQAFAELFRRRGEDLESLSEAVRSATTLAAALMRAFDILLQLGPQFVDAGTSVGANYREANRAESRCASPWPSSCGWRLRCSRGRATRSTWRSSTRSRNT